MAGFKKVTQEYADLFIKLYKKYTILMTKNLEDTLNTLPTDVIERCFDGAEFFRKDFDQTKIDDTKFGFAGLCGYSVIKKIADELNYCRQLDLNDSLDEQLQRYGHKVNRRKIGISQ